MKDWVKLVAARPKAADAATTFCAARQLILPAIEQLAAGSLERLQRIDDAVNAVISPDPLRRGFLDHERLVDTHDLLNRLKQLLVLNWRQKSSARSQLKLAIQDTLDTGLPRAYDKPLLLQRGRSTMGGRVENKPTRK